MALQNMINKVQVAHITSIAEVQTRPHFKAHIFYFMEFYAVHQMAQLY